MIMNHLRYMRSPSSPRDPSSSTHAVQQPRPETETMKLRHICASKSSKTDNTRLQADSLGECVCALKPPRCIVAAVTLTNRMLPQSLLLQRNSTSEEDEQRHITHDMTEGYLLPLSTGQKTNQDLSYSRPYGRPWEIPSAWYVRVRAGPSLFDVWKRTCS